MMLLYGYLHNVYYFNFLLAPNGLFKMFVQSTLLILNYTFNYTFMHNFENKIH